MMETGLVEMGVTQTVDSNAEIQSEMLEKNVKMVML